MRKTALHPFLAQAMGLMPQGPQGPSEPPQPDYGAAPQDASTPMLDQGQDPYAAAGLQPQQQQQDPYAAAGLQQQQLPQQDPYTATGLQPQAAPPDGGVEDDGTGEPALDPNDPLMVGNDEGLYAVNPDAMIGVLGKLLTAKYALWIMYQHYGSTLLARYRDGVHEHFQTHAAEEQAMAYALAKKIVALGGQTPPKVAGLRPAGSPQEAFLELLKAEQKSIKLWRELALAAGQNLGLSTFAGDGARDDTAHADDLRRYLRAVE